MSKNKKEKKIVKKKETDNSKLQKAKVLRCKNSIHFITSMKCNLDLMCTSFKRVVQALNNSERFEQTDHLENNYPKVELCPPSSSTSNVIAMPVVDDKSQGFKSYFNIQNAVNEEQNSQKFYESIPKNSPIEPKPLKTESEIKGTTENLVAMEEIHEKTSNCSIDSFNCSKDIDKTPIKSEMETCDVSMNSLCTYDYENSIPFVQNESLKEDIYKPGPVFPMASNPILFQGGSLFKVKLSNLKPSIKYDDVHGILSDIGVDSNTVEDIMLVNHTQQTFVVISFNDNENMMKALSLSKKINHHGRIITIKPVSNR